MFYKMLSHRIAKTGSLVCVGLDSTMQKIPQGGRSQRFFNRDIIAATRDLAVAYKINPAPYLRCTEIGIMAMRDTIKDIHCSAPGTPVILDGKWGDVCHINAEYAKMAFNELKADAVTVNPLFGRDALEPFFEREDKGIFVVCSPSNSNSHAMIDASIYLAEQVATDWNRRRNAGLVVGATQPAAMRRIRKIIGDGMPILSPGGGEQQGGDIREAVMSGMDKYAEGLILSFSRQIIFASQESDFAEAARRETIKLRDEINAHRYQYR